MLFFVKTLGWGLVAHFRALTASIMILPTIVRSTEETIKSVPREFRKGSYGLGATKIRTIFKIILPTASPGILAGHDTEHRPCSWRNCGAYPHCRDSASGSGKHNGFRQDTVSASLPSAKEGISFEAAFATATVLIITVLIINFSATFLSKKS